MQTPPGRSAVAILCALATLAGCAPRAGSTLEGIGPTNFVEALNLPPSVVMDLPETAPTLTREFTPGVGWRDAAAVRTHAAALPEGGWRRTTTLVRADGATALAAEVHYGVNELGEPVLVSFKDHLYRVGVVFEPPLPLLTAPLTIGEPFTAKGRVTFDRDGDIGQGDATLRVELLGQAPILTPIHTPINTPSPADGARAVEVTALHARFELRVTQGPAAVIRAWDRWFAADGLVAEESTATTKVLGFKVSENTRSMSQGTRIDAP